MVADELEKMMDPGAGVSVDSKKIVSQISGPTEEQGEDEKAETDFEESKDIKGKTIWTDTPTFEDQYKRFPQSTKLVGPVVAVYDVTDSSKLNELNHLLSLQQPEEAPRIIVVSRKENFHEGKWLMLLEYFKVHYKKLITTS